MQDLRWRIAIINDLREAQSLHWPHDMLSVLVAIVGLGLLSIPHCALMCGPIAALAAPHASRSWGYHLGRAAGYATLGVAAGIAGSGIASLFAAGWGQALLSWSLAAALALAALRQLPKKRAAAPTPISIGKRTHWVSRLFAATGHRSWVLGYITALLPCGVLWAAVALSVSSASPLQGAVAMVAFAGVTSLPLLGSASLVRRVAHRGPSRVAFFAFALGAVVLIIRPLPMLQSSDEKEAQVACPLHAEVDR